LSMSFRRTLWHTAALLLITTFTACSTNGLSQNPKITQANLSQNKGTLGVGTARLPDGTVGLNVVATYRQANGLSATLANTPMLTGPTGFVVPTTATVAVTPSPAPGAPNGFGGSGSDASTAHISGSPENPNPLQSQAPTTFGQIGGVFASGFGPFNDIGTGGQAYYPGNTPTLGAPYNITSPTPTFGQPFFATAQLFYIGGPPAYRFFNDGSFPNHFAGYLPGFMAFEVAPVAGTYTLAINVPAANASPITQTASATLGSTGALPPLPTPTFASDHAGGGTGTVNVPSGAVETLVFIVDQTANLYYTAGPMTGAGMQSFSLPDNEGPCAIKSIGCQPGPSMASGDTYNVFAVSFDYQQFEAEPPVNVQQVPTVVGANGQADLTMSTAISGTQ
jgi:hypothetical protein